MISHTCGPLLHYYMYRDFIVGFDTLTLISYLFGFGGAEKTLADSPNQSCNKHLTKRFPFLCIKLVLNETFPSFQWCSPQTVGFVVFQQISLR